MGRLYCVFFLVFIIVGVLCLGGFSWDYDMYVRILNGFWFLFIVYGYRLVVVLLFFMIIKGFFSN